MKILFSDLQQAVIDSTVINPVTNNWKGAMRGPNSIGMPFVQLCQGIAI